MKAIGKIFKCVLCGCKVDERMAKVEKAKKGWHFCAHDGWIKDEQVTEWEKDTPKLGEPIPATWLNKGR